MSILGSRIKELRKKSGLSQERLSKELNKLYGLKTDRVMISKWETGFQTPVINTIKCLAQFFNVSIDFLNGDETQTTHFPFPSPNITEDYTTFPVIGEIAAGWEGYMLEPDWEGETVDIPNSYLKGRPREDFFVLQVKGDSMYPLYHENDKVLIYKQSSLDYSGQIGAIVFEDDHITLKKVEFIPGETWLRMIAINPTYPPKRIENEELEQCRVLGIPKLLLRDID